MEGVASLKSKLKNDLILKAARGDNTPRPPVWLMRQAGRILPQYRKLREKVAGFKEIVETPELACEVTLQPVDELGVDAAIIFSDILVIPQAMGLPYQMIEEQGPSFEKIIQTEKDVQALSIADPDKSLDFVIEAIKLTKSALNGRVPLIGFAGAPWTIMAYMTEGSGSKTFTKAKSMLYGNPELANQLLEKITESTIQYLKAQIKAGADIVQLFDTWAGILAPDYYETYGLHYIDKICKAISEVPVIVFAKGAAASITLSKLDCAVIGLDWTMDIAESRELMGEEKTLQGNLDPGILMTDKATIKKETTRMLEAFGRQRYIANLGHGVYPDTPLDKVKYFIEIVKGEER